MHVRLPILLGLLVLIPMGFMLWWQVRGIDFSIAERVQAAEQERHGYVISHDFDLLKERLIEVHRDHWIEIARLEQQARINSILLGFSCLTITVLLIVSLRKKTPTP